MLWGSVVPNRLRPAAATAPLSSSSSTTLGEYVARVQDLRPETYGRLKLTDEVLSVAGGVAAGAAALATDVSARGLRRGLAAAVVTYFGSREVCREIRHPPNWRQARDLGFAFDENGTHYIKTQGDSYLHCSHGFGANSLSFAALGDTLPIIAHDHPGFGLTELTANTSFVLDGSRALGLTKDVENPVYLGHSMGAVAATDAALVRNAPLILIAPALRPTSKLGLRATLAAAPRKFLSRFIFRRFRFLYGPPTRFFLRRAVHASQFWDNGLAFAAGTKQRKKQKSFRFSFRRRKKTTTTTTTQPLSRLYGLPSLVARWDQGLFRYLLSRVLDDDPYVDAILLEAAAKHLPGVLIIHGVDDPIIPVDTSRLLYCELPRSKLVEIPGAGHNPHETHPEKVAAVIADFLKEQHHHDPVVTLDETPVYEPREDHYDGPAPRATFGKPPPAPSDDAPPPPWPQNTVQV